MKSSDERGFPATGKTLSWSKDTRPIAIKSPSYCRSNHLTERSCAAFFRSTCRMHIGSTATALRRPSKSITTLGNPDYIRKGYPVIELIASSDAGHPPWRLLLIMDPYQLVEGENQLDIDHFTVWAQLTQGDPGAESEQSAAFGISGTLDLDEFSREPGAAVSGRFTLNMGAFRASGD